MTSYDSTIQVSQPASFVGDVLSSYQRSQMLAATSALTTDDASAHECDEECGLLDGQRPQLRRLSTALSDIHFPWDWEDEDGEITPKVQQRPVVLQPETTERSTLLQSVQPTYAAVSSLAADNVLTFEPINGADFKDIHSKKPEHPQGQSTFAQSLVNSVAILVGIGLLSEPLAFSYAGWIGGTFLICFYGWLTCYTAKILGRMILDDPTLQTYADIGRKAFGQQSTYFMSTLFCFELFTVSVVLVTLFADSLHQVLPVHAADAYKILAFFMMLPTMFMPLSTLSFASLIGVLSNILVIGVVILDGVYKQEAPGSLWDPAQTSILPASTWKTALAFGLFMAGFSGHAAVPSIVRDMAEPAHFERMLDFAFVISTVMYASIGAAGYAMFGTPSEEISQDLLSTIGYPAWLNQAAVWMLVLTPITKYALATRPMNLTIELALGIQTAPSANADAAHDAATQALTTKRPLLLVFERTLCAVLSVVVSILVPNFAASMAFLGSFTAFVLCVLGPLAAKIMLERRCSVVDLGLLLVSVGMAVMGTMASAKAAV